ncbi:hypothetical protein [Pseudonocardia sp.]|uniref:hypothetical protein n=1 Tax=Pseudonocardia sp. TaxID=60912 RepID=UPI002625F1A5|nr:hypothetical protein [Pseudonocardia sp.]
MLGGLDLRDLHFWRSWLDPAGGARCRRWPGTGRSRRVTLVLDTPPETILLAA